MDSKDMKYRVIAECWIPALDTVERQHKYIFHNTVYNSEEEALKIAQDLRESGVTGEFITVTMTEVKI